MTRTDVMASSRPQTEVSMRRGMSGVTRRLSAISALLLLALALALPGAALAAEPTAGYNQTPTTPKTGTSPSKEEKSPASEPAPEKEKTSTTPTTSTTEPKTTTLPFTGFDLRWSLAVGVLLMGAGFSIVAVQRRQRRDSHR
jgi:cytoskeletal protein RodZ